MASPSFNPGWGMGGLANGLFDYAQKSMPQPGSFGSGFAPSGYRSPTQFGFGNPMGQSYASGRSYLDPQRMAERQARLGDRMYRQQAANYGAGGGSRGGGGGRAPVSSPQVATQRWTQEDIADQGLINYGNMPSMGMDYANSQARIMGGTGSLGDFGLAQQRHNPSVPSDVNNARARQQWRLFSRLGYNRGLVGTAQEALFG